jgi:hypothetical protein
MEARNAVLVNSSSRYRSHSWTLIPKGTNMANQAKVVKSKNSALVYVCYPIPDVPYLNEKANVEGFVVPTVIPDTDSL